MVTVMVWTPAGVPVFVEGLEGEDELQPENENRPTANKSDEQACVREAAVESAYVCAGTG